MNQFHFDLAEEEITTILVALRFYQESGLCNHRKQPNWVRSIATNGGKFAPLDNEAIEQLCVKLNLGGVVLESKEEWPNDARCENCGAHADFEEFVPTDGRTHLICPECGSSNCFEVHPAK